MKKITIRNEEIVKIEQINYLYISSLKILTYLLKQPNINDKYVNIYLKKSEYYYIYLNLLKNKIFNKYNLNKSNNYSFDLDNNYLIYEE